MTFNSYIKYKKVLRRLQENETREVKCHKIDSEYENNKRYNCSIETIGANIVNVGINEDLKEFIFVSQEIEIEIISLSLYAVKYMDNLQNAVDKDLFNKKIIYIRIINVFNRQY